MAVRGTALFGIGMFCLPSRLQIRKLGIFDEGVNHYTMEPLHSI